MTHISIGFISGIAHHTFEIYFISQEWSTSTFRLVPVSELASYTFWISLNLWNDPSHFRLVHISRMVHQTLFGLGSISGMATAPFKLVSISKMAKQLLLDLFLCLIPITPFWLVYVSFCKHPLDLINRFHSKESCDGRYRTLSIYFYFWNGPLHPFRLVSIAWMTHLGFWIIFHFWNGSYFGNCPLCLYLNCMSVNIISIFKSEKAATGNRNFLSGYSSVDKKVIFIREKILLVINQCVVSTHEIYVYS